MASNEYQPQDLESILRTLSNFTQPAQISGTESRQAGPFLQFNEHNQQQWPIQSYPADVLEHQESLQAPQKAIGDSPDSLPGKPTAAEIDPANIVDWSTGLRHVTRLAARNEQLGRSMQKIIKVHHENVRQWEASYEALLQTQTSRKGEQSKLDDVLRLVGGIVSNDSPLADNEAEVKRFNLKVHRAMTAMTKDMTQQLIAMGVPFFNTNPVKVRPATFRKSEDDGTQSSKIHSKDAITQPHLEELQRKMLQHLSDMYEE